MKFFREASKQKRYPLALTVTSYVTPALDISYYGFLLPSKLSIQRIPSTSKLEEVVEREEVSSSVWIWQKPSKLRISFCVLWQTCFLLSILAEMFGPEGIFEKATKKPPKPSVILDLLAYPLFLCAILCLLNVFWKKRDSMAEILNRTWSIPGAGMSSKSIVLVKFVIAVALLATCSVRSSVYIQSTEETTIFREIISGRVGHVLELSGKYFLRQILHSHSTPKCSPFILIPLGLVFTFFDLANNLSWVIMNAFVLLWACHFKNVLEGGLDLKKYSKKEAVENFVRISYALDKLNGNVGYLILTVVICETLYITNTAVYFLSKGELGMEVAIYTMGTFIPFLVMLVAGAQVNGKVMVETKIAKVKMIRQLIF